MSGPLTGYRIVDLTAMISGPVATMMLADQGAEVIKVEPPAGDIVRRMGHDLGGVTSSFVSANRSKKSVVLDLKTDLGRGLLDRLVESADVFVQNFRPERQSGWASGRMRSAPAARTSSTSRSAGSENAAPTGTSGCTTPSSRP